MMPILTDFSRENENPCPLTPIGTAYTDFKQKFGIPRQSGMIAEAKAVIVLNPEFNADSVRGLAEFSHVWVIFRFHQCARDGFSQLVRPPRLGGKIKKGVFATRSPHRPNFLGLSLMKLEKIETKDRVCIYLSGADLLDNTPVFDIKPYLPHLEAVAAAAGGFSDSSAEKLAIVWLPEAFAVKHRLPEQIQNLIEACVRQDPRPAHQNNSEKNYIFQLDKYEIQFFCREKTAFIFSVRKILQ